MTIGQTSAQMALRDPDIRLMLKVRDDDQSAFVDLVNLYQHRLIGILNHILGNKDEAEDIAQEVFLRIYRDRKKYTPTAKFSTWLFTIANNLALNAIRNRKRKNIVDIAPVTTSDDGSRGVENILRDPGETPSFGLRQAELTDRIQNALDSLNERQKMAVVLNKFEDMNYAEIAEVLGIKVQAVKSLLSRARMKLREALSGYMYMDGEPIPKEMDEEDFQS